MSNLTTRQHFNELHSEDQFELLHKSELTTKRLERIVEGLLHWREGTSFHDNARMEYNMYLGEKE